MSPMAENPAFTPARAFRLTPFRAGLFWQTLLLVLLLLILLGPVLNLLIWTVAERWYFPHALPAEWGMKYWSQVFSPYSDVGGSLLTSIGIALLTVAVCLVVAVPAGYALSRKGMPLRFFFMLLFLIPQAFPGLTVYMNVARLFYQWGLNGTITGVVLVHSVHGMMYAIWISVAAFSSVDPLLSRAARNLGASAAYTFFRIVLPQAAPGIIAASIFVFLESLDEFTGAFFVGAPDISTLPLLLYNASMSGNYQISSITALILLLPSVVFMLVVNKFMRPEMLSKLGK
ncbi:ABC transporter permease [Cronobacter muytjensii]|nr:MULTISPECIES: ABC transporter permease subunit [Cronobacter]EKS1845031.1 ABC transporter permease subunit [Cronobacter muytjensii]ELY2496309.1 ABC transporter permease subunit [Cronobacter muytjensii]ELY3982873.1 ABC transporter permease subunit [Cronobacter muytjensii]ELY4670948.1 ABC transporter permease subunit [Cronobacter muytjensii]ELY6226605.1 ABC transporter permease subunit [Cronobacter muytjensii]